jgi:hypothetical protein
MVVSICCIVGLVVVGSTFVVVGSGVIVVIGSGEVVVDFSVCCVNVVNHVIGDGFPPVQLLSPTSIIKVMDKMVSILFPFI